MTDAAAENVQFLVFADQSRQWFSLGYLAIALPIIILAVYLCGGVIHNETTIPTGSPASWLIPAAGFVGLAAGVISVAALVRLLNRSTPWVVIDQQGISRGDKHIPWAHVDMIWLERIWPFRPPTCLTLLVAIDSCRATGIVQLGLPGMKSYAWVDSVKTFTDLIYRQVTWIDTTTPASEGHRAITTRQRFLIGDGDKLIPPCEL